jgi:ATP-dependent helicase HrpB
LRNCARTPRGGDRGRAGRRQDHAGAAGDRAGGRFAGGEASEPGDAPARRVAARAAAERLADENGWTLGREVGYHVRFDRSSPTATRLRVVTEGILTRQLLDDPFLDGIGAVVLDEFHERSIHTDLAIALLREEVRQSVRDDLMLIVMSATLEAEPVAKFLGDCPIVSRGGRTFPVGITHESRLGVHLTDQIVDLVSHLRGEGDVLIFPARCAEIPARMRHWSLLRRRRTGWFSAARVPPVG